MFHQASEPGSATQTAPGTGAQWCPRGLERGGVAATGRMS